MGGYVGTPSVPFGTYAPPNKNSVVFGFTSFVARGLVSNAPASGGTIYDSQGWWEWFRVMMRQRLDVVNIAGINGDTIENLISRLNTDFIAYQPGWVILDGPVNNVYNSSFPAENLSAAQIETYLTTVWDTLLAAGIKVVQLTIGPHNGASTAQQLVMNQVDQWMRDQAASRRGLYLCDWSSSIIDVAGTNNWNASYSADGLHPNSTAAARIAKKLFDLLDPIVPRRDTLVGSNADTDNLFTNGFFNGTLGAGTPTGWTVNNGTPSIVARTDQGAGRLLQVVNSTAVVGQVIQDITAVNAGDSLVASAEVFAPSALTSASYIRIRLIAYQAPAGSFVTPLAQVRDLDNNTGDAFPLENDPSTFSRGWVLRSPKLVVPAGFGTVRTIFEFNGQGTVQWGRASLRKVA